MTIDQFSSQDVSVVLITKNEEAVIRRCLESVQWADEIIVMDSGSTDRTVQIARDLNAVVHVADWPGPGPQRNRGITHATKSWILALDADEWVNPELRDEILATIAHAGDFVGYRIPRLSSFCGRYMRHSGWWPDYVSRLFKRGSAQFGGGIIHDHLVPQGPLGKLRNHLMHEAFVDLNEVLGKINNYSTWGAQAMCEAGHRGSLNSAIGHGLWAFFRTYVLRAGFLDGREGFMLSVSNAEGTYYRYLKLQMLANNTSRTQ